ncbi:MAG: hypothetical protein JJE50_05600 [Actinomycetales bacterium]|nr:hypothetical protein [Actinomycetales bacterium]
MGWVTPITGLFLVVIIAVVVVTALVSSGRIAASMEDPYRTDIEWREQSTAPGSAEESSVTAPDGAPPDKNRGKAHPWLQ